MNPIINPSTLSEEQREAIRECYSDVCKNFHIAKNIDKDAAYYAVGKKDLFESLFGSEFFTNQKGE